MQNEKAIANLLDQFRLIVIDQLKIIIENEQVESAETVLVDLPFTQYMTNILLGGPQLEISIRFHFMLENINNIAKLRVGSALASSDQAIDFIKEFSNVVAGKGKTLLEGSDLFLGQSLPFCIQGYNEIFFPKQSVKSKRSAWHIKCPSGEFIASIAIEAQNTVENSIQEDLKYEAEFDRKVDNIELF